MIKLLKLLASKGGAVVSTASLSPEQVDLAREEERMYVDQNGLGYVWLPKEMILDWTINDNQISTK